MNRKDFLKKGLLTSSLTAGFATLYCSKSSSDNNNDWALALLRSSATITEGTSASCSTNCAKVPEETTGPYPFKSSSSPYIRSDIREDRTGIQLDLTISVLNTNNSCSPIEGLNVYIWHCDQSGYYSQYSGQPGILGTKDYSSLTFLRGIQTTDSSGNVKFVTIYPGWYTSRATHIHVQVYSGSTLIATSQIAFPESTNTTVNSSSGYSTHGQNSVTNTKDNIFGNSSTDLSLELACLSGTTTAGFTANFKLGIAT
ncbi:intradiol ring-cleavage dioxygenase [Leptospira ilyithenensis]|uniref:Intradiol ring-cleavage dioxygenase n=1 Tax=Leptospira ilyithenensis TaxID=2484901 RepID=A0A4R9LN08_9LEPT|nr:intradiol ring-cleavage dioxygenase [Leptospira ilyithenensis]TGN10088.1 intradiol ring-cleavage dioxygenase [Leptospira ilyithenensis]